MNWVSKITDSALPVEGGILLAFFLAVFLTSLFEKEERPAYLSLIAGILISLPYLLPFLAGFHYPGWITQIISILPFFALLVLIFPFRGKTDYLKQTPVERFDERDTMFSRRTLVPGTKPYDEYYERRPENKAPDNQFRRKPGLLKAGTKYYDPILFAAAQSIFEKVETELHPRVDGTPAPERMEINESAGIISGRKRPRKVKYRARPENAGQMSRMMLETVLDWGAHSTGITELRDYHVYSVGGRGDRYGVPFTADHKYALALTVEMDYEMMRAAPAAPTVLESARQYLQSGLIAVHLAELIRSMGYPARAHIDGNYQVICPLVARDAGLGEIGRMGLLMTPRLGPRCRIAVITTDLPLIPGSTISGKGKYRVRPEKDRVPSGSARHGATIMDFCRRCEKCTIVCPAGAIPDGPEREISGSKRWQINSENCYTYWCQAGTDCGRCMIVCPFSHPDNWFHRLVRFGIRNNYFFRRIALPLDDLFYGKQPEPRKMK